MRLNKSGRKILKRLRQRRQSSGVRLRSGRYQYLNCPFHEEKTAPFTVDFKTGRYYCFGCHDRGDIWHLAKNNPEILGTGRQYHPREFFPVLPGYVLDDDDIPF